MLSLLSNSPRLKSWHSAYCLSASGIYNILSFSVVINIGKRCLSFLIHSDWNPGIQHNAWALLGYITYFFIYVPHREVLCILSGSPRLNSWHSVWFLSTSGIYNILSFSSSLSALNAWLGFESSCLVTNTSLDLSPRSMLIYKTTLGLCLFTILIIFAEEVALKDLQHQCLNPIVYMSEITRNYLEDSGTNINHLKASDWCDFPLNAS